MTSTSCRVACCSSPVPLLKLTTVNDTQLQKPRARRFSILFIGVLAVSTGIARAQCPAVGNDTTCGTVITVTNSGASVSSTGQGPYDGNDDTLVGVINTSSQPIYALGLTSGIGIFGFDGDGLVAYGVPGNPSDSTGYGGPNAYFSNIGSGAASGVVNFITPIPANGGTGYFALENALSNATACASVINNAVSKPPGGGTQIRSTFTPNFGYTLAQAAKLCGFTDFDWQQLITSLPSPSPFFAAGSTTPLTAPPPFNDPPPNGYAYQSPPNAVQLPVYYNLFTTGPLSLVGNETTTTLSFFDAPADPCLHGGSGAPCGGLTAPAGSKLAFSTHLVGILGSLPGASVQDTGIGFSWTDTFNGTAGGISVINSSQPVDPGSGTGGIAITNINEITSYQYPKSVSVSSINGIPAGASPSLTLLTGTQIASTASGLAYSRPTQTFNGTVTITNVGNAVIDGPFQIVFLSLPSGVTLTNATGTFGGFPFITISTVSSLAPGQSATVDVRLKNPSAVSLNLAPVAYTGSFN